ncbi:DUF2933 domain-containing protein [Methylophaga sp. OBS4]|uniref:DUF2933 domain-containing protein n=1 Tax=Methylophaga sp. OBS4 TaxID=2991935 RepID=UPI00224C8993|nr:DUF2933 domain-containing protein [Methylophaga sp. OBS4]MCX4186284.1 DUF2933 domain-containing protein [Methylophaga sp. OBS4]
MHPHHQTVPKGFVAWFLSWRGVVLTVVLAAISYWLLTEHFYHFALFLPYLILLACPLMHIFGHGHGKHHGKESTDE